jgi:hypothetical protein
MNHLRSSESEYWSLTASRQSHTTVTILPAPSSTRSASQEVKCGSLYSHQTCATVASPFEGLSPSLHLLTSHALCRVLQRALSSRVKEDVDFRLDVSFQRVVSLLLQIVCQSSRQGESQRSSIEDGPQTGLTNVQSKPKSCPGSITRCCGYASMHEPAGSDGDMVRLGMHDGLRRTESQHPNENAVRGWAG